MHVFCMKAHIVCSHVYTHIHTYAFSEKKSRNVLVLGIKPKALQLLGNCSTLELPLKSQHASFAQPLLFNLSDGKTPISQRIQLVSYLSLCTDSNSKWVKAILYRIFLYNNRNSENV